MAELLKLHCYQFKNKRIPCFIKVKFCSTTIRNNFQIGTRSIFPKAAPMQFGSKINSGDGPPFEIETISKWWLKYDPCLQIDAAQNIYMFCK